MTYRAVLRGYLLEEALAWLLRNSGYELLTDKDQDPEALGWDHGALVVHGRGADHQVDVLGNFALTPAFSLPIRMFLEAKYYSTPCRLPIIRNAHGVIHDVNENFIHPAGSRPRRRYQYVYALFSASGFTRPAQDYGLAQQISLVDLSSASFGWLKDAIAEAAAQLYLLRNQHLIRRFPVSWMRQVLCTQLGTPSAAGMFAPQWRVLLEGRARTRTGLRRFGPAATLSHWFGGDRFGWCQVLQAQACVNDQCPARQRTMDVCLSLAACTLRRIAATPTGYCALAH
jgi:hypothetical protein